MIVSRDKPRSSSRLVSDHWLNGKVFDVIRPNLKRKPIEIDGCTYFFQIAAFEERIRIRLDTQTGYSFANRPKIGVVYPSLSIFGYKLRRDFHNCCVLDLHGTPFDRNGSRELGVFFRASEVNILPFRRG